MAAAIRLKIYNGIDVSIYEIRSGPATGGGAISIPPNGLRLFDGLGLYQQLAALGNSASHLVLHSNSGATIADVDRAAGVKEKTGFGYMRVLRSDVMNVLLEAARAAGGSLHYGKKLVSVTEDSVKALATFQDGSTATADMLLGCDGNTLLFASYTSVLLQHQNTPGSPICSPSCRLHDCQTKPNRYIPLSMARSPRKAC